MPLRSSAVSGSLGALVILLGGIVIAVPASAEVPPESSLTVASTPDEPLLGGRSFTQSLQGVYPEDAENFFALFQRQDATGSPLIDDPALVVGIDPSIVTSGNTYNLDASSRELWLGDLFRRQESLCPDLTGEVTFDEFMVDGAGVPTAIAATFTLRCTPEDAIYGALGYNAPAPQLPAESAAMVAADAKYPPVPTIDPDDDSTWVQLDVHPTKTGARVRWDAVSGFTCVQLDVTDSNSAVTATYAGRDDTYRLTGLDPTLAYHLTLSFAALVGGGSCDETASEAGYEFIAPLTTGLDPPKATTRNVPTRLRGFVEFSRAVYGDDYPEFDPVRQTTVNVYGKFPDRKRRLLGSAVTNDHGRFHLDVVARKSMRLTAVVPAGRIGPLHNVEVLNTRSTPVRLSVHRASSR